MSTDTSLAAHDKIKPRKQSIKAAILEWLWYEPLTCEELEDRLTRPHQTISARLSELAAEEKIIDSGERRDTKYGNPAIVYKINLRQETISWEEQA